MAFQYLISCDPGNGQDQAYSNACMKIMEVIASPMNSEDYEKSARAVAGSLLTLLLELSDSQQVRGYFFSRLPVVLTLTELLSLGILFNLLSSLVSSLPNFSSILLLCRVQTLEGLEMSLIDLMAGVIAKYWGRQADFEEWHSFTTQAVAVMQALCFYQQEDTTGQ